jgi:hypothetical protein
MAKKTKIELVVTKTVETFRAAGSRLREVRETLKSLEAEDKRLTGEVRDYVAEHGAANKSESIEYIDEGVKWLVIPQTRTKYDEAKGLEALHAAISAAKGAKKEALAGCVITKQVIDADLYAAAKAAGHVPADVVAAYESTSEFSTLRFYYVDKCRCPTCDAVVERSDKFCSKCGATLPTDWDAVAAEKQSHRKG